MPICEDIFEKVCEKTTGYKSVIKRGNSKYFNFMAKNLIYGLIKLLLIFNNFKCFLCDLILKKGVILLPSFKNKTYYNGTILLMPSFWSN